jgi:hypothetical protein
MQTHQLPLSNLTIYQLIMILIKYNIIMAIIEEMLNSLTLSKVTTF